MDAEYVQFWNSMHCFESGFAGRGKLPVQAGFRKGWSTVKPLPLLVRSFGIKDLALEFGQVFEE
jgi:hypothetical protein